jgi:drug/metabolite transporter (DMT)-like permease
MSSSSSGDAGGAARGRARLPPCRGHSSDGCIPLAAVALSNRRGSLLSRRRLFAALGARRRRTRAAAVARPASASASLSAAGDWALLVLPGLIWGASFLFIAEGLDALAPDGVTFVRIAIGFATLALVPAARAPLAWRGWPLTALLGLLWMAFPLSMFPHAEQHVSSAMTGMLNGATPLFTAVVASVLTRRAPSRAVSLGLVVGLTGAVLVAVPTLGEGASSVSGVLLIVAALVSYGFAINLARPLQQQHGALPVVWRALGVSLLLTAPLGAPAVLDAHWTWASALSLLALGALGTGLANVLVAIAAGRLGAARASATTFLIPAVALALGVLVRGERVGLVSVTGGIVCLAGAWLIRQASLRRSTGAP